jgi:hypothetical protein
MSLKRSAFIFLPIQLSARRFLALDRPGSLEGALWGDDQQAEKESLHTSLTRS